MCATKIAHRPGCRASRSGMPRIPVLSAAAAAVVPAPAGFAAGFFGTFSSRKLSSSAEMKLHLDGSSAASWCHRAVKPRLARPMIWYARRHPRLPARVLATGMMSREPTEMPMSSMLVPQAFSSALPAVFFGIHLLRNTVLVGKSGPCTAPMAAITTHSPGTPNISVHMGISMQQIELRPMAMVTTVFAPSLSARAPPGTCVKK
mmetsp:Transcript_61758/g.162223  ORF Transcript_61758/g.162223 Transcript_61758/m.162223 type:complete len:204 (-) Transcript_61758:454-1065(-)